MQASWSQNPCAAFRCMPLERAFLCIQGSASMLHSSALRSAPLPQCSCTLESAPMVQCSNGPVLQWSSAPMVQCSCIQRMLQHSSAIYLLSHWNKFSIPDFHTTVSARVSITNTNKINLLVINLMLMMITHMNLLLKGQRQYADFAQNK